MLPRVVVPERQIIHFGMEIVSMAVGLKNEQGQTTFGEMNRGVQIECRCNASAKGYTIFKFDTTY